VARAWVYGGGGDVGFGARGGLVADDRGAGARHELESRRARVVEETNDLRAERFEKRDEAARALGAGPYLALKAELTGLDYAGLSADASRLLADTERAYLVVLEPALAARAGVRPAEAARADALRAFRLDDFDRLFPARRMAVVYRDALAGLGVRTGAQPNVRLDLEERPTKSARAFCSPIRVPGEVVLSVRPSGGYGDYAMLMHEAGHAQHFAFTSPDARVAFARAGDVATTETYAFLFHYLMNDADFLDERFSVPRTTAVRATAALARAYAARRCAGMTIYEEELHAGRRSLATARDRFEETLFEATRVRPAAAEYLADLGDGTHASSRLRALALEVQVRDHLKTRFGRRWWASRPAGELLKELWSTGGEYTADELAAELGLGAVSFDPLATDLVEGLAP
jgi:hypothetical protein